MTRLGVAASIGIQVVPQDRIARLWLDAEWVVSRSALALCKHGCATTPTIETFKIGKERRGALSSAARVPLKPVVVGLELLPTRILGNLKRFHQLDVTAGHRSELPLDARHRGVTTAPFWEEACGGSATRRIDVFTPLALYFGSFAGPCPLGRLNNVLTLPLCEDVLDGHDGRPIGPKRRLTHRSPAVPRNARLHRRHRLSCRVMFFFTQSTYPQKKRPEEQTCKNKTAHAAKRRLKKCGGGMVSLYTRISPPPPQKK